MFCYRRRNNNKLSEYQSKDYNSRCHAQGLESTRSVPFTTTFFSIIVGNSSPKFLEEKVSSSRTSILSRRRQSSNFDILWTTKTTEDGDYFDEPPSKIQRRLSSYEIKNINSRTFLNSQDSTFYSNSKSNSIQEGEGFTKKDQFCMQERWTIMNEGQEERKECWTSDGNAKATKKTQNPTTSNRQNEFQDESPEAATTSAPKSVEIVEVESDYGEDVDDQAFAHESASQTVTNDCHQTVHKESSRSEVEEVRNESSTNHFLFIGPVGKKRRHCRERRTSGGDPEVEVLSPASIPATPETRTSTPDPTDPPALVEYTTSEDSTRSRGSGSSRESRESGGNGGRGGEEAELTSCSGLITSTPTSVIRSAPPRINPNNRGGGGGGSSSGGGYDQPLNLSLPPDLPFQVQGQSHSSYSSNNQIARAKNQRFGTGLSGQEEGMVRERVSVINIAPITRERLLLQQVEETEEDEEIFSGESEEGEVSGSPSHYLQHHGDLPELGFGHGCSGGGGSSSAHLSPGASTTSQDFYAISSGSVLSSATGGSAALSPTGSNEQPSSFQGLLLAQGIITQQGNGNSSSALKKKLKCRDCGKEFSQLRNYKYHRSRHEGTQQFACTCPVCGKTFNDKGYLSSHLKIHRNEKEYKCEWCGKSFNQRVAYNMHIRIHTGHKPHQCTYCTKAFSRKMLLRQHIRTHTGERPYKCVICSKAFADRSNMLLHQRLHSGERPYRCHICGKSFSKNHHLKTHLNHHAGVKPYQCEKCKACFSQSSNMKTHFRKCTRVATINPPPPPSSTITSDSLNPEPTQQLPHHSLSSSLSLSIPGPSSASSSSSLLARSPISASAMSGMSVSIITQQNLSPYSSMEEIQQAAILEEQLQQQQQQYQLHQQHQNQRLRQLQPEQFIGLSPLQQQQLLQEMSLSLGLSSPHHIPSPLHSPNNSSSSSTHRASNTAGYRATSTAASSASSSRSQMGMPFLPQNHLSPYSVMEESVQEVEEQQQHQIQIQQQRLRQQIHPDQYIYGLSPLQQQQFRQEMSASLSLGLPQSLAPHRVSPLHSPSSSSSSHRSNTGYRSSTSTSTTTTSFLQVSASSTQQALGFSMGSMNLNSPPVSSGSRSRRSSGLPLLPPSSSSSHPSPTSLAAGHPFIPLNALESITSGHTSSSGNTNAPPHLSPSLSSPYDKKHY